jgi:hypothetical protein
MPAAVVILTFFSNQQLCSRHSDIIQNFSLKQHTNVWVLVRKQDHMAHNSVTKETTRHDYCRLPRVPGSKDWLSSRLYSRHWGWNYGCWNVIYEVPIAQQLINVLPFDNSIAIKDSCTVLSSKGYTTLSHECVHCTETSWSTNTGHYDMQP